MKKWWKNIGKKKDKSSEFKKVVNGDQITLYDKKTVDYFESKLPNPTLDQFLNLIEGTSSIIVSEMVVNENTRKFEPHKVLEINEPKALEEAIAKFEIKDEETGHLMCMGEYTFEFITSSGQKVNVEFLGGGCIRIEEHFKDDAALKDGDGFLYWLESIGIEKPLRDSEKQKAYHQAEEQLFNRWLEVTPIAVRDSIKKYLGEPSEENIRAFSFKLKNEFQDENQYLLKLFELHGFDYTEWNVERGYQQLISAIVMAVKTEAINKLYEECELEEVHKEGISRLIAGWDFSQTRKNDIALIDSKLKEVLFDSVKAQGDQDKINAYRGRVLGETINRT